jgi:hypothetical protein
MVQWVYFWRDARLQIESLRILALHWTQPPKYIFPLYTYEGRGLGPVEDHPSLRTLGMSPHTHTHTHTQHWVSPEARRALLELFAFQLVGWLVIGFLLQLRQWNPTHWLARRGPAEPDLLLSQGL